MFLRVTSGRYVLIFTAINASVMSYAKNSQIFQAGTELVEMLRHVVSPAFGTVCARGKIDMGASRAV